VFLNVYKAKKNTTEVFVMDEIPEVTWKKDDRTRWLGLRWGAMIGLNRGREAKKIGESLGNADIRTCSVQRLYRKVKNRQKKSPIGIDQNPKMLLYPKKRLFQRKRRKKRKKRKKKKKNKLSV